MRAKRFLLVLTFVFGVWACTQRPAPSDSGLSAAGFETFLDRKAEEGFSGVVLIAVGDEIKIHNAYGFANREHHVQTRRTTTFPIYSISKQLTASFVLDLARDGRFALDDCITDHIPRLATVLEDCVSIAHLLSNTGGVTEAAFDTLPTHNDLPILQSLQTYFVRGHDFPPGSKFRYSPFGGYMLLAALIEKATGKTYADAIEQYLTEQHGLKNTGYFRYDKVIEGLAAEYRVEDASFVRPKRIYLTYGNAGAGLYATAFDIFQWSRRIRQPEADAANLFSTMTAGRIPADSGRYGYGLYLNDLNVRDEPVPIAYHGGSNQHLALYDLKYDRTVIVLSNVEAADVWDIARKALEAFSIQN